MCMLFIPYISLFLLPFLFIPYFCMYAFFSFDATILVNKDVYIILTNIVSLFVIPLRVYGEQRFSCSYQQWNEV